MGFFDWERARSLRQLDSTTARRATKVDCTLRHHELMSFRPDSQDGARSLAHHPLRHAPQEHLGQCAAAVRSQYDQVDLVLLGVADYFHKRNAILDRADDLSLTRFRPAGLQGL